MLSFLHTADLQIGMTASSVGRLAKQLQDARIESLQTVVRLALERHVDFVLIAGDMFESNQISKKFITQAARILENANPLRVFILPGNHDYYGPNSVYQTDEFTRLSTHVVVFRGSEPFVVPDLDLTLYPGPCFETRSNESPARLIHKQHGTTYNVTVLHGSIPSVIGRTSQEDEYFPMSVGELANLEMDYVALGHWHSLYPDPSTFPASAFFYSGTPEPTGFGERLSGQVLSVELEAKGRKVTALPTAQYNFIDREEEIKNAGDVESLRKELNGISDSEKVLIRLTVRGVVSISTTESLAALKNELETRFAYVRLDDRDLLIEPDESDLHQFVAGGIAATTFTLLKNQRDSSVQADKAKYARAIALAYKAFKGTLE